MADVRIRNEGTIVLFEPLTEEARIWVSENVVLESWQWLGTAFGVEHRYAQDLAEGMVRDGLKVE